MTISTTPIATLTSCLRRYAVGSPPVRSSRADVADQTSRLPTTSRARTATISSQSSPGARRAAAGRAWRRCRSAAISHPFRPGGRIEPSFTKVGSLAGGEVPGIAARSGSTSSARMP